MAVERGVSHAELALAWMLSKPGITSPIVGATQPHHLTEALAALSRRLTPQEIAALEEPHVPHLAARFN
jgi:aryl-alcohol dehydrogenase-like predicted oxidoreductase